MNTDLYNVNSKEYNSSTVRSKSCPNQILLTDVLKKEDDQIDVASVDDKDKNDDDRDETSEAETEEKMLYHLCQKDTITTQQYRLKSNSIKLTDTSFKANEMDNDMDNETYNKYETATSAFTIELNQKKLQDNALHRDEEFNANQQVTCEMNMKCLNVIESGELIKDDECESDVKLRPTEIFNCIQNTNSDNNSITDDNSNANEILIKKKSLYMKTSGNQSPTKHLEHDILPSRLVTLNKLPLRHLGAFAKTFASLVQNNHSNNPSDSANYMQHSTTTTPTPTNSPPSPSQPPPQPQPPPQSQSTPPISHMTKSHYLQQQEIDVDIVESIERRRTTTPSNAQTNLRRLPDEINDDDHQYLHPYTHPNANPHQHQHQHPHPHQRQPHRHHHHHHHHVTSFNPDGILENTENTGCGPSIFNLGDLPISLIGQHNQNICSPTTTATIKSSPPSIRADHHNSELLLCKKYYHPLFAHGVCRWPGCELVLDDVNSFVK